MGNLYWIFLYCGCITDFCTVLRAAEKIRPEFLLRHQLRWRETSQSSACGQKFPRIHWQLGRISALAWLPSTLALRSSTGTNLGSVFVRWVKFLRMDLIQKYLLVHDCASSLRVVASLLGSKNGNHMVTLSEGISALWSCQLPISNSEKCRNYSSGVVIIGTHYLSSSLVTLKQLTCPLLRSIVNDCFGTLILLIKTNKFCMITRAVRLCSQLSISGIVSIVVITNAKWS